MSPFTFVLTLEAQINFFTDVEKQVIMSACSKILAQGSYVTIMMQSLIDVDSEDAQSKQLIKLPQY